MASGDIFSGPDTSEEGLQVLKRVLFSSSPTYGSLNAHNILSLQSLANTEARENIYQMPYILE